MKQHLLIAVCLMSRSLQAFEGFAEETDCQFYVKQNFFVTSLKGERQTDTHHYRYKGSRDAYGWCLGYEMTIPEGLYTCMEGSFAIQDYHGTSRSDDATWSFQNDSTLSNVLARVGFETTAAKNLSLTSFFELGGYFWRQDSWSSDTAYGALGQKLRFSLLSVFDVGFNVKFMRDFYARAEIFNGFYMGPWGYQIALPLIWHMQKSWDVQAEPYVLKFDMASSELTRGVQLMIGYVF